MVPLSSLRKSIFKLIGSNFLHLWMSTQSFISPYWSLIMKILFPIEFSLLYLLSLLAKKLNMKLKKFLTLRPFAESLYTSLSGKATLYLTTHRNLLRTWNIPSISHGPFMRNISSNSLLLLLLLLPWPT